MASRGVKNPRFSAKSAIRAAILAPRGVQEFFQDASGVEETGKTQMGRGRPAAEAWLWEGGGRDKSLPG